MADHDDMFAGASDASSSSHDRYTTTPEGSPPPPGPPPPPPPPPPSTTAETIRDGFMVAAGPSVEDDSTIEMRLRRVNEVKIMSTTLSHPRSVDPEFRRPLWNGEEALRFIALPTMDDLARTSMELSLLVDKKLRKKVFNNKIDAFYFHVLDFNFTLIKNKVLGRFTTTNREHYNSQQMVIFITISPGFARTWTPTKMDEWIKWRDAEDAADRGLTIEYRVSGSFTLDEGELEEIRVFLHYHNLYGDKGGDMRRIMMCFKQYFVLEYQRLGI